MCTIFGYFKNDTTKEIIEKALQKTITRGPDDQRISQVKNGWLGFQRLSIMGYPLKECNHSNEIRFN